MLSSPPSFMGNEKYNLWCVFLRCLQCNGILSVAQLCLTLCDLMDHIVAHLATYPWDFPGKRTGVGCHFLLQRIFPTQGLNPCFLHWQADSLSQRHLGITGRDNGKNSDN